MVKQASLHSLAPHQSGQKRCRRSRSCSYLPQQKALAVAASLLLCLDACPDGFSILTPLPLLPVHANMPCHVPPLQINSGYLSLSLSLWPSVCEREKTRELIISAQQHSILQKHPAEGATPPPTGQARSARLSMRNLLLRFTCTCTIDQIKNPRPFLVPTIHTKLEI